MAKKVEGEYGAEEQSIVLDQHVRIVNLSHGQRQFSLTDGSTVSCGPLGESAPILRKLIGPTLRALEKRGVIRIENVGGE